MGRTGLQWHSLLPLLFRECKGPVPDVLVIHLGGDDLGLVKGKALVMQVLEDLLIIKSRWPWVKIVWSAIIPHRTWRHAINPEAMKRTHRNVNREIRLALLGGLGECKVYPELTADKLKLYRSDGVHLLKVGMDIFPRDVQQGLWMSLSL